MSSSHCLVNTRHLYSTPFARLPPQTPSALQCMMSVWLRQAGIRGSHHHFHSRCHIVYLKNRDLLNIHWLIIPWVSTQTWEVQWLTYNGSVLDSRSSSPGLSPGQDHCVVFWGKILYSHSASLHPCRSKWVPVNCQGHLTKMLGITCDELASHPEE